MEHLYEKALESAEYIKTHTKKRPKIAVVLGSGLGKLTADFTDTEELSYKDIPNFPVSTVAGHKGALLAGKLGDTEVYAMEGRFHFYEGYSMKEVCYPFYVFKLLDVEKVVLTNACGGINREFAPGTLMLITDFMAGTDGTGFGTASYLRSRNPNLQVVLVQSHPDSRLTPEHPDAQIIDGVLPAYDVPESALFDYLRPDWSDACINVRTEEAYETAHEVLRAEGLFLGTSAAAALHAAVQVGRRPENQRKNIVVIVPDNGMKYLSTPMYRQK